MCVVKICGVCCSDDWPEDGEEPQVPPVATGQTDGEQNGDTPTADKTEEQT